MKKITTLKKIILSVMTLGIVTIANAQYSSTSATYFPAAGSNTNVSFNTAGSVPGGAGTLTVYLRGDWNGGAGANEFLDVSDESAALLGSAVTATQCGGTFETTVINVSLAQLQTWTADGTVSFDCFAGTGIGFCTDEFYLELAYPVATYCASNATSTADTDIENVQFNTINQSSVGVCTGYTDYTAVSTTVMQGSSHNLSITTGDCNGGTIWSRGISAFIDWNADGDFADAGETILTQATSTTLTASTVVNVPPGATIGSTVMRVVTTEGVTPVACGTYTYGETEDYTINITAAFCSSTITTYPYNEDFESFAACGTNPGDACVLTNGWNNEVTDDIDWTTDAGGTPSTNTGPGTSSTGGTDFNPGTSLGKYLYTEASTNGVGYPSMEAIVTSPCFDLTTVTNTELVFAYNMNGPDMGTLFVDVTSNGGSTWTNVWLLAGNQGDVWTQATVDLSAYDGQNIKIRFRGITGANYGSDFAIDDVTVQEGCSLPAPTTGGDSNCGPGIVNLTATPGTGGTTCFWYTVPTGGTSFLTGNSFSPNLATTTTYYVATSDGSCESGSRTAVTGTIFTPAAVFITNLNTSYCVDAAAITMNASPAGGTFSGSGVSGSTFDPAVAGAGGPYNVIYTYTDGNGCTSNDTVAVTVNALPTVTSSGLGASYCTSDPSVTLSGSPAGGSFSGAGVSGSTFDPVVAGAGTHTITYTYTDGNGCTNTNDQSTTITTPPSVSFSGLGVSYCADASAVALTGSPSGGSFSGNGISGSTFDPSLAGAGTHTITYSYTDGNGCTNTSNQNVTVNALPTLSISNLNGAYCLTSGTASMTGSPVGGTFTGNGVSGNTFDPVAAGTGSHTVTYTYTDGNGCTNSVSQQVDVVSSPVATITMNSTYCDNDTAFVVDVAPIGGTLSGTGVSGGMFDPSVAGAGTHTLIYDFNAGAGCSDSDTITVTVSSAPTGVSFTGLAGSYCGNDASSTLTGSPAGGTFSGTGVSGSSFDPALAGAGTHTVSYTVSNGGCSTTSSQNIVVNAVPTPTISGLSVSGYCVTDGDVTLTGSPAGGTFSGVGVSGSTFSPSTAGAGNHQITYTYTDGNGCVGSTDQMVAVVGSGAPVAGFTFTVNGNTASFSENSTNASSWSWDFDDGGTSTSQDPGSHTFASAGTYNVCLSVLNACGGSDILCKNVTISGGGTPNAIADASSNMYQIYPNPTSGNLNVKITLGGEHDAHVEILDVLGQTVSTFSNEFSDEMNTQFDLKGYDSGVYFVKIVVDNNVTTQKVILEK